MVQHKSNRNSLKWAIYFILILSGLGLFQIYHIYENAQYEEKGTLTQEDGRTIIYGKNAEVLMQEIIVQDSFVERKTWYATGKPKTEIHFTKSFLKHTLNGEKIEWYENGLKKSHYYFLNDQPDGAVKEWFPNGHLQKVGFYTQGKMCGRYQEWHQNGIPAMQGMFQFGKNKASGRIGTQQENVCAQKTMKGNEC